MPGRRLLDEGHPRLARYDRRDQVRRRAVLRETVAALEAADGRYHALAETNLARWRAAATSPEPSGEVRVLEDDWGAATHALTRHHGRCFAVLNMANAHHPGGAYVEGTAAQEENMFRRTDCHFTIDDEEMDPETERYRPATTALLRGAAGAVYLDTARPRVCVRGPEDRAADDLGYPWLADDEVFPFFELRAAAQDCRAKNFDEDEARRRIAAQLDTLVAAEQRYAVLSAFGCGAFQNPTRKVARLYREEIDRRRDDFALIAFAIFHPGYGLDNHLPFAEAFGGG